MKAIGVDLPITKGDSGYFNQTFSTSDAIKVNLKNLLLTNNGERPLNPSFGLNLNNIAFEQDNEINKELIRDRVIEIINRYEPSVLVQSVNFLDSTSDSTIQFRISFSLKSYPSFIDTLQVEVNTR